MENLLREMECYAKENDVPIIEKDGIEIVSKIIIENNIKSILEIGTAIGYSALKMNLCNLCSVTTIERDEIMYNKAVDYITIANKQKEITLIFEDALNLDDSKLPMFDMLYIDAAKGQYKNFFEKYLSHINEGGIILFDNLLFHGFVNLEQHEIKNRNTRQLIRKIKEFIKYIESHKEYDFTLIQEGDGIGIAMKKKES
ncbi:MAG: O-methyltransferase [Mycoplasmatales bacterium]